MNLEHFPTSERARVMLNTISADFYEQSYVGKWLFQVMGMEMDEVRKIIVDELPLQAFPETATWGLMFHEIKYGLPVNPPLSYEERRKLITNKRDLRPPVNPYNFEQWIQNITGRIVHVSDDEPLPVNTFSVKIDAGETSVDIEAVLELLNKIKQSHVSYSLCVTEESEMKVMSAVSFSGAYMREQISLKSPVEIERPHGIAVESTNVCPAEIYIRLEAMISELD